MSWVKLDDGFPLHPKVAGLSSAAFRGYVTALCYCSRYLTDGVIPLAAMPQLGITKKVLHELVASNLVSVDGTTALINNYLEHQTPRAKVEAKRESIRERVKRHRNATSVTPLPAPLNPPPCNGVTDAVVTPLATPVQKTEDRIQKTELPGESDPKDLSGQGAPEPPGRPPPAHLVNSERSFWPTVELWDGPKPIHRDFARQNGLDVGLERVGYEANRRKNAYRCADFDADFSEWLAKSVKFARPRNGSAVSTPLDDRPLTEADKRAIAKAKRIGDRLMAVEKAKAQ